MSKFSGCIAFAAGAAVGAAGAWYYLKDKYARIADEEIASVKEAYANERKKLAEEATVSDKNKNVAAPAKNIDKGGIAEYAKRLQDAGYTDYSGIAAGRQEPKPSDVPYVISPDEFGEFEDYTKVSLSYYEDGVLADECGEEVDDVEEIVGDGLEHFGEYEEDSVFVRNDAKRCDYEILKVLRNFSDVKRKEFPPVESRSDEED